MKVLGVTGGIGSGKSYVCRKFAARGIPVYDSDSRTKELYNKNADLVSALAKLLGKDVVKIKGGKKVLDTKLMAAKIFSDEALLEQVAQIVHPVVMQDFRRWRGARQRLATLHKKEIPFVILESAVILENPEVKRDTDFVATVSSPLELRIERVSKRDNTPRDAVLMRIASQWSDSMREAEADFTIQNAPGKNLERQIDRLYNKIKNL